MCIRDRLEMGAAGVFGTIGFVFPVVAILLLEVLCFFHMIKKNYVISAGVLIAAVSLIMKICGWIFDDFEFETASIIAYRIFAPYNSIAGWSLLLSALITVMLYGKAVKQ